MLESLHFKSKDGFVTGALEKPTDEAGKAQWGRCNVLVKSWLISSMTSDVRASVISYSDARTIWLELKEHFNQTDSLSRLMAEMAVNELKQGNMNVSTYYMKLKTLWDEKMLHTKRPTCNCEGAKEHDVFLEEEKTMKFLTGLNEEHLPIRNAITSTDPLQPIAKVYSLVLQSEKQGIVNAGKQNAMMTEASAFAAKAVVKRGGGSGQRDPVLKEVASHEHGTRYCEKCHLTNHSTKYCRSHITCSYCNEKGHSIEYCRTKKRNAGQGGSGAKANMVGGQKSELSALGLSTKEYDHVMDVLGKLRSNTLDPSNGIGKL